MKAQGHGILDRLVQFSFKKRPPHIIISVKCFGLIYDYIIVFYNSYCTYKLKLSIRILYFYLNIICSSTGYNKE